MQVPGPRRAHRNRFAVRHVSPVAFLRRLRSRVSISRRRHLLGRLSSFDADAGLDCVLPGDGARDFRPSWAAIGRRPATGRTGCRSGRPLLMPTRPAERSRFTTRTRRAPAPVSGAPGVKIRRLLAR